MAEERVTGRDGSVTIISDSYGTTRAVGAPEPPDDPTRWSPPTLSETDLLKRYDCTKDQIDQWIIGFQFPRQMMTKSRLKFGSFVPTLQRIWSEEHVMQWEAEIRGIAARLPKIK